MKWCFKKDKNKPRYVVIRLAATIEPLYDNGRVEYRIRTNAELIHNFPYRVYDWCVETDCYNHSERLTGLSLDELERIADSFHKTWSSHTMEKAESSLRSYVSEWTELFTNGSERIEIDLDQLIAADPGAELPEKREPN